MVYRGNAVAKKLFFRFTQPGFKFHCAGGPRLQNPFDVIRMNVDEAGHDITAAGVKVEHFFPALVVIIQIVHRQN